MSWTAWWKSFDGDTTTEIRMTNNQQRRQLFCATPPYTSHSTVANPENTQKDTDISRTWRDTAPPASPPPLLSLQVSPLSSLLFHICA